MANNNNDDKGYSFFQKALIAAPVAVGGFRTYSNLKKSGFFSNPAISLPINTPSIEHPANHPIREFAKNYINPTQGLPIKQWQLEKLESLATEATEAKLSSNQILESLARSAKVSDPTNLLENVLKKRLSNTTSARDMLKDFSQILSSNPSIYMQRTASLFLEDLQFQTNRATRGLSTEGKAFSGRISRQTRKMSAAQIPHLMPYIKEIEETTGLDAKVYEKYRKDIIGSQLDISFYNKTNKPVLNLRVPRPMSVEEILGKDIVASSPKTIIQKGATQQSRYITGMYGIMEGNVLRESYTHEEFMLKRAVEDLLPRIKNEGITDTSVINSMFKELEQEMSKAPEWIPSIQPGEHKGIEEYMKHRSNIMHLYTYDENKLRQLDELEYYKLMQQGGAQLPEGGFKPLYPGFSPGQIAKGIVATEDVRPLSRLVPNATAWSRRPLQFLRLRAEQANPNYVANDPLSKRFAWSKAKAGIETPIMKTVYLSPRLSERLHGTGVTSEGQFLYSKSIGKLRYARQFNIDLGQNIGADLAEHIDLNTGMYQSVGKTMQAGSWLGYSPEGEPVTLPSRMHISHVVPFEDPNKKNFMRVFAMEEIEDPRYAKFFGIKGMGVRTSKEYLQDVLKTASGSIGPPTREAIDMLTMADDLIKDRSLHYNQMFTALWDFTNKNIQSGLTNSKIASNFANNPEKVIAAMHTAATNADKFSHERMLYGIHKIARSAKLTPEQIGLLYGAVPDVFQIDPENVQESWARIMMKGKGMSEQEIESALSIPVSRGYWTKGKMGLRRAEQEAIMKGIAQGYGQIWFEDTGGSGAGKVATIEPRAFELYGSPHFGAVGPKIQQEIAERMIAAYPERLMEQAEINDALKSISNLGTREGTISPGELSTMIAKNEGLLPNKATSMRLKDIGDIYIPGATRVSQLSARKTQGGAAIESTLALAYHNTIDAAKQYESGGITKEAMMTNLATLEKELVVAKTGTVTGPGGLLRNRVPGSAALTAVQPVRGEAFNTVITNPTEQLAEDLAERITGTKPTPIEKLGPRQVGVTQKEYNRMFESLMKLGKYSDKEKMDLLVERERFLQGEEIPGLLGRHPYVGPHSTQVVGMKLIEGNEAIAMINERKQRAIAFRGKLNEESMKSIQIDAENLFNRNIETMSKRAQKMGGEIISNPLRLSPLVGLAGDVDGDVLSVMLAGPKLGQSLTSYLDNDLAKVAYEDYSIRSQLLKAKAKGSDPTLRQMMAGDSLKLGITKGKHLGMLSTELQQYRAAVLSNASKMSAEEGMQALGLLEWMEYVPIGSKHVEAGKELQTVNLLEEMETSLSRGQGERLAGIADVVLANAKPSGKAMLHEGVTLAMEDVVSGEVTTRYIPGIDLGKTVANLENAKAAFESTEFGRKAASDIRKTIMKNRGYSTGREATEVLRDLHSMKKTPFGGFFTDVEAKSSAEAAEQAISMMTRAKTIGKSILEHAKPLAIGAGVGLGLAAILSEPPESLAPDSNITPLADMKSGTGGANLGFGQYPHEQMMGQPTAANLVSSQHSVRLRQPDDGNYRVQIRGTTRDNLNMNNINSQFRNSLDGNARINSSIRDQRASLTPQRLSSILQDE